MKDSNGNEYTWIGGDASTAPCVVAKTGGNTNWYYVLRDHLGNITHLMFASTSTVAGEYRSGAGVLQIKPINYLDSYTNNRGGTIYYREFNWLIINKTP